MSLHKDISSQFLLRLETAVSGQVVSFIYNTLIYVNTSFNSLSLNSMQKCLREISGKLRTHSLFKLLCFTEH